MPEVAVGLLFQHLSVIAWIHEATEFGHAWARRDLCLSPIVVRDAVSARASKKTATIDKRAQNAQRTLENCNINPNSWRKRRNPPVQQYWVSRRTWDDTIGASASDHCASLDFLPRPTTESGDRNENHIVDGSTFKNMGRSRQWTLSNVLVLVSQRWRWIFV
jgi:hypothetical protein